ncbi:MAG: LemA family protein [Paludibacteraceae bacterium]|nr:LemA family protein [Paludibacteraceae bacterium]
MKRLFFGLAVLLGMSLMLSSCDYNELVEEQEEVEAAWAEVQNQYQRRMDLIPNLVNTVKGYAEHEQNTLNMVTSARAKVGNMNLSVEDLDEETMAKFQKAQEELSQGIGRLLAVAEAYPDLKANQNFLQLQDQLEGTENRIAVARRNFNDAAREYNAEIRKFPTLIYAGWFGFKKKPYFESQSGAEYAPEVKF